MLTKKEVINWIERVEQKALSSVRKKYNDAVVAEENRILKESGAQDILDSCARIISQAVAENERLNTLVAESKNIRYEKNAYFGLSRQLADAQEVKSAFTRYANFESKELTRLKKSHEETERNVRANYAAVREAIKNKSNARRCLEYLKEVGFDVSDLEKLECTEIAVAVDKRYLFVCGENK